MDNGIRKPTARHEQHAQVARQTARAKQTAAARQQEEKHMHAEHEAADRHKLGDISQLGDNGSIKWESLTDVCPVYLQEVSGRVAAVQNDERPNQTCIRETSPTNSKCQSVLLRFSRQSHRCHRRTLKCTSWATAPQKWSLRGTRARPPAPTHLMENTQNHIHSHQHLPLVEN